MAERRNLDRLVEEIRALSPQERRRLARQLRLNGLLETDAPVTDPRPLAVAPALSPHARGHLRRQAGGVPQSAPRPAENTGQTAASTSASASAATAPYKSAVSGRVVVGAPGEGQETPPSVMPPLPGQAPEQPIRVVFDGGSKGNPGQGYGSYALDWPGFPRQVVQLKFGDQVTNNEAEYDTLIAALEAISKRLQESGADLRSARLDIWGDSLLVLSQIKGEWKVNKPELENRRDRARGLLAQFGQARLSHHKREKSVEVLGH